MKVMVLMIAKSDTNQPPPTKEAILAMHEFNEELQRAGVLLDLGGLTPTTRGVRIHQNGNKRSVVDGPFAEAKEQVAGYSLWEVKNLAEAVEWVKRSPMTVGWKPGEEPIVELRPLFDASDFDPGKGV